MDAAVQKLLSPLPDFGELSPEVSQALRYVKTCEDGQCPERLPQADVVLLGASRTKKTPTCVLLGFFRAVWAANVPIVPSIELPHELRKLDPRRIVFIHMLPHDLAKHRKNRPLVAGHDHSYADRVAVKTECAYVRKVSVRYPESLNIDVTDTSIEEVASAVYQHLSRHGLIRRRS